MVLSERLRYVTVPTNREARFQDYREVFDRPSTPLDQLAFGLKSWFVVHPLKFLSWFVTVDIRAFDYDLLFLLGGRVNCNVATLSSFCVSLLL